MGADLPSNILSPDVPREKLTQNDRILMPNNVQMLPSSCCLFSLDLPIFLFTFSPVCPIPVSQTVAEFKCALFLFKVQWLLYVPPSSTY
jgi:hypothetical protein